jgi:hypothetical protein
MKNTFSHTVNEMRENILAVYRTASAEQIAQGMEWYSVANATANAFAQQSGYSLEQCAAVIAATSPNNGWGANKRLAGKVIDAKGQKRDGYFKANLDKANRVLNGEPIEEVLTSQKVGAFYAGIATNGLTDVVCVDRHAYCIAVDDRSQTNNVSLTPKRYNLVADAYREAAELIGITAAQVQAITWVVWRNRFWAEGAFDGK